MDIVVEGSGTNRSLPRGRPLEQGVSPAAVARFLRRVEEDELELHSLMIVRNGHVVTEGWWKPYHPELPHSLNSLSKSFTSTAIGLAVEEGLLTLDDTVISFFPEEINPSIEENMASLRVRHLLSMSTGHAVDTTPRMIGTDNWVKAFLEIPIVHEPGTFFLYNTGATYMLSAIISKVARRHLLDYLQPRLFDPLGISGVTSSACPRGIHAGGFGMKMKTEDIAKFGLLYLQRGVWEGRRVLPPHWAEEATDSHIPNGMDPNSDWAQGYGFQFWRCRNGAYRGDGAFGQFCVVMPEQNTVIAMTGGVMEMQTVLDLVWGNLLPGIRHGPVDEELDAQVELYEKLGVLAYPVPDSTPSQEERKWHWKIYRVGPNDAGITEVSFHFYDDAIIFHYRERDAARSIRIGRGEWAHNRVSLAGSSYRAQVAGTWRKKNRLEIVLRFVETPFCDTWVCHFVNDSIQISVERNVWVMPGLSVDALFPEMTGYQFADRDMWIGNGLGRDEVQS